MAHSRDVAKEIKDFYVDTMSKVLFSYFKSYSGRLAKLQVMDEPNCYDISCEVLLLILFLNHWLKCRTFKMTFKRKHGQSLISGKILIFKIQHSSVYFLLFTYSLVWPSTRRERLNGCLRRGREPVQERFLGRKPQLFCVCSSQRSIQVM